MSIRNLKEDKLIFISMVGGLTVAVCVTIVSVISKHNENSFIEQANTQVYNNSSKSTSREDIINVAKNNSLQDNEVSFSEINQFTIPQENYSDVVEVTDDYVERELRNFAQSMKERKKWKFAKVTDREIKFNSKYSKDYKEINTVLYQIVAKYFTLSNFEGSTYKDYIDPLYIMAVSNVEFGYATSPNVLLAPAIPTNKGIKVTKDNILTFGIADYLEYPSVLRVDRDGYRGPLQMYVTGMTKGIIPEDLVGSEYTRILAAKDSIAKKEELAQAQYIEGSGISSTLDGMRLSNMVGQYGDRFNYSDAVNRLSGNIKSCWEMYERTPGINKFENYSIDNKYSFMAMTAIGHNSSPGIYYIGDNKTLGSQHYWWPFGTFGQAREYCHYLGKDECINYIRDLARQNLQTKDLTSIFKLSRVQGYNIAEEFVAKGYIPSGLWKRTCWNHEEKIGYPIQVLYNYFILEAIYEGL